MALDLKVPSLGESVSEAFIGTWVKKDGEAVKKDEVLVTLETDKANVELRADQAGTLHVVRKDGTVKVGELIARIDGAAAQAAAPAAAAPAPAAPPAAPTAQKAPAVPQDARKLAEAPATPSAAPAAQKAPEAPQNGGPRQAEPSMPPALRRRLREQGIDPASVDPVIGKMAGGRYLAAGGLEAAATPAAAPGAGASAAPAEGEKRTPMTRLRKRIAERLLEAQRTAAILTTFNEIDMSAVMETRARHKEGFKEKHGVALGFMSFFARAVCLALRDMPVVNSEIRGEEIISREHVHLGVAVSTEQGLVVPVVRNAHRLDFAGLEREIGRMAILGRDRKLQPDDLAGGTFTISNGGVFGSLLSTPILNPPQAGILGMHKIEDRPVVKEIAGKKEIVIRPMMYVALSYDHRLIDGKDSVTFLVKVKERLEDPSRLLLDC